jgi:hypothetical protein
MYYRVNTVIVSLHGGTLLKLDENLSVPNSVSGHAQIVNGSTRGDALLDVYRVRPEILVSSCTVDHGISDHCGV